MDDYLMKYLDTLSVQLYNKEWEELTLARQTNVLLFALLRKTR